MRWHLLVAALIVGSLAVSGSAAGLPVAKLDQDAVVAQQVDPGGCARSGCLQPVQMPMGIIIDRPRPAPMPADQRELLARLLRPELSEFVDPKDRQIASQLLDRGIRLEPDAVRLLSDLLREKESLRAELQQQAREDAKAAQALADAKAAQASQKAKAARALAEAKAAQAGEDAKAAQALAEAKAAQAREDAKAAQALAEANAEQAREDAKAAQALADARAAQAEAEREAEAAAAANAARLVFYDEFPPLQPL